MTRSNSIQTQQQLRNPHCNRALRFTKEGYAALIHLKKKLEAKLERPISESVAIDMVLLGSAIS